MEKLVNFVGGDLVQGMVKAIIGGRYVPFLGVTVQQVVTVVQAQGEKDGKG